MMAFLKTIVVALLTWEAKMVLRRHAPRIIAITGSVGKTTTKDAVFAALSRDLHVRKSAKSFNSEIGVPLTILGLENAWSSPIGWIVNILRGLGVVFGRSSYPAWLVLEVGADRPGDIQRTAKWLRPDISVITGVPDMPVHVEYFGSVDDVLKEKSALAQYLKPGGKLILNGDDPRMRALRSDFRGASITYGIEGDTDYAATHVSVLYEGTKPLGVQFRVNRDGSSLPISVYGALGYPRVYAACAALAVAECAGVDQVAAAHGLSEWEPPAGRVRIIDGWRDSVLIDDTYNSSPAAALAALDSLKEVRAERRIAILGDMLELGRFAAEAHKQVGERASQCADMLITIGFRSRAIAEAALDAGMRESSILQYEQGEAERAGKELAPQLKAGDVVLIKGSQGMRMEKMTLELMAEPSRAAELLVRMDPEWQTR